MKIGIDAGHGGRDPGAIGRNPVYLEEEDVTLSVALELKSLLEENGHQVVTTRTSDTTVSLFQRSNLLNNAHVDLVVSIHVNAGEVRSHIHLEGRGPGRETGPVRAKKAGDGHRLAGAVRGWCAGGKFPHGA